MNIQQLRILREAVVCNFNFTEVANVLFTSQSGVSKHIKDLEDELGIELFERKGKRILGLTEPGCAVKVYAEKILTDLQNIRRVAENFAQQDAGCLVVATTHTQARYALTRVVAEFKTRFPRVELSLHQGSPKEIARMLIENEADIGIATEGLSHVEELQAYPFYTWHHVVIAPTGHPLLSQLEVSLSDLAKYPIVTYQAGYTGRSMIDRAFNAAGLKPHVVLSAQDADVIKAYVELGLGIGIIAPMAFDSEKDHGLKQLTGPLSFQENNTLIAVKKDKLLRGYAKAWIQLCNASCLTK